MATTPRDGLVALLVALLLLAVIGASVGWFVGTKVNERRADTGYVVRARHADARPSGGATV